MTWKHSTIISRISSASCRVGKRILTVDSVIFNIRLSTVYSVSVDRAGSVDSEVIGVVCGQSSRDQCEEYGDPVHSPLPFSGFHIYLVKLLDPVVLVCCVNSHRRTLRLVDQLPVLRNVRLPAMNGNGSVVVPVVEPGRRRMRIQKPFV